MERGDAENDLSQVAAAARPRAAGLRQPHRTLPGPPPRDAHPQRRFLAGLPELGRRFGASKNSRMSICFGEERAEAETRAEVEAEAEPEACLGETVAAGWAEAEAESGSAFGRVASTADAALG